MSEEIVTVTVMIEARITAHGRATMTRARYDELCSRLDDRSIRGFRAEELAEEIAEECGVDIVRDGDISGFEVSDFCDVPK